MRSSFRCPYTCTVVMWLVEDLLLGLADSQRELGGRANEVMQSVGLREGLMDQPFDLMRVD
jgi:hypothetical protein